MGKPKSNDFDDSYRRNGTLQVLENDIICIWYGKNTIRKGGVLRIEKTHFFGWQDISRDVKTIDFT